MHKTSRAEQAKAVARQLQHKDVACTRDLSTLGRHQTNHTYHEEVGLTLDSNIGQSLVSLFPLLARLATRWSMSVSHMVVHSALLWPVWMLSPTGFDSRALPISHIQTLKLSWQGGRRLVNTRIDRQRKAEKGEEAE